MALLSIPVVKAKAAIEIETGELPDEVYQEALIQGLKVLLNRGASKITKETYPAEAELKAAAMAKAVEQVELVKLGKIKFTGQGKATKASGAVMTEARRLAKNIVKDAMKAEGIKISHVEPKEITKAANEILNSDLEKEIVAQAEANLAERSKLKPTVSIAGMVKTSPELVAKAEAKKASDKAKRAADKPQLSATQAGKVAKRAKGQQVNA